MLVMPGLSRPKDGVASARLCPGHPRLATSEQEDVDGRVKPGHDARERALRLWAVIALDDHEIGHRMRLPDLDVGLVFGRVVTGHRGLVVGELDHHVARAALALGAGELAAAHDEATTELLE